MKDKERIIKFATTAIEVTIDQTVKEARREALEEVAQMMFAKANMIERVLDNGYDLWLSSKGSRYEKLYQQRYIVLRRWIQLRELAGEVMKLALED